MNSLNKVIVTVAAILGVSVIIATSIVTSTYYKVRMSNNNISVAGTAVRDVTSDSAVWGSSFSRTVSPGDIKGGTAQMKNDLNIVLTYLHNHGVTDAEISIQPMNRYPICATNKFGVQDCSGSGLVSYNFDQYITVQTSDVHKVESLSQNSTADLATQNVFFSSQPAQYYYSRLDDMRVDLTGEATKSAKARAEKIAESTGATVGLLQAANVSSIQVSGMNTANVSDYGGYDTTSIDKKITLVVHATFGLR